jgi:serine/threonine protein phosphatase PrpC
MLLSQPASSIYNTFQLLEEKVLKEDALSEQGGVSDKSGSSALTALIIESKCFIAWLGDSRAILSKNCGKQIFQLTSEHKPADYQEQTRVRECRGSVFK